MVGYFRVSLRVSGVPTTDPNRANGCELPFHGDAHGPFQRKEESAVFSVVFESLHLCSVHQYHWLSVDLVGDPSRGTSRDAIGAQVIATGTDDLYVWRHRSGGEGYLSMGSPELEMGLGGATSVDLEVIWPGGVRQRHSGVGADQRIRIHQGREEIEILPDR